jgi:hypothetical protein
LPRFGGGVLLPELSPEEAKGITKALRRSLIGTVCLPHIEDVSDRLIYRVARLNDLSNSGDKLPETEVLSLLLREDIEDRICGPYGAQERAHPGNRVLNGSRPAEQSQKVLCPEFPHNNVGLGLFRQSCGFRKL